MLGFFRKYQKFFFVIVTIFVVISFSFFGTFSTFSREERNLDKAIGKTVNGAPITSREMEALMRLVATSSAERGSSPNLFNDGVIANEFLKTGMAAMLADTYFDTIKEDLALRLKKAKHYKPYVHPKAPFISAEMIWQQYFPSMSRDLVEVKGYVEGATLENFSLLMRLYLSQLQLPPETLKQFLVYQQSHYQNLPPDPQLQQLDLSLFGFHSIEEWFGPQFLQLVCRFILNSAAVASEKGYLVTNEEARADLFQNLQTALKAYGVKGEETSAYFQKQLRLLQLDENTAIKAWRKVMLFKRLFHDVGNAVVVDPFIYKNFEHYASDGVVAELYELPEELRLKSVNDLIKLHMYLEAVTGKKEVGESLPVDFLPVEEVEKRFPELIVRRFEIEVSEASKQKLASQVSLKETWEWELEEKNWNLLRNAFSFADGAFDVETRFEYLEKMDPKERFKIDAFARMKIVDSHPEWVQDALAKSDVRNEVLNIRSRGGKLPLSGIKDPASFADLLLSVASRPDRQLEMFSEDEITYYNIKVIEAAPFKEILLFAEGVRDGTLQTLVDLRLETAYPDVRRKDSAAFQSENGSWRPFQEVKEEIGRRLYASLTASFENRPQLRFVAHMQAAKNALEMQPNDASWIRSSSMEKQKTLDSLVEQWRLEKTTHTITRASQDKFPKETLLALPVGTWSEVQTLDNGNILFARILEKVENVKGSMAKEGQEILSIGARRYLMSQLLEEMVANGS
jgi:GcvH upstream region-like protein